VAGEVLVIEGGTVATMDGAGAGGGPDSHGAEHAPGHVVVRDGRIAAVGPGTAPDPEPAASVRRVDASGCLVTPGLVNTHHHLYQWVTRGLAVDDGLFGWLSTLYPVWGQIDEDITGAAAVAGLGWLARTGCTTSMDHHYVFPTDGGDLLGAEIEAARERPAGAGGRGRPARPGTGSASPTDRPRGDLRSMTVSLTSSCQATYYPVERKMNSTGRKGATMSDHGLRYLANCSMLFTERPLLERPQAARDAGFEAVEFWWPWPDRPVPADAEVDGFVAAVRDAGVQLVGLNFFAGDLTGPDCGVLSIPARVAQFRDNVDVTVGIGERLGVSGFNALYGNRVEGVSAQEQDELGREQLGSAAAAADRIGATVLVESVSGPKPYPLRTAADAAAVVHAVRENGHDNVGFLCDLFHLANNGDDVSAAIAAYADLVAHVQIADCPGRGEPGTGDLDLDGLLAELVARGYEGWVGLEYKPTTDTEAGLAWLPTPRRSSLP